MIPYIKINNDYILINNFCIHKKSIRKFNVIKKITAEEECHHTYSMCLRQIQRDNEEDLALRSWLYMNLIITIEDSQNNIKEERIEVPKQKVDELKAQITEILFDFISNKEDETGEKLII